jgi:uncharacterized membrane protein
MRAAYLVSVWIHILAAMTWMGGMVLFVVAVMPYFRGRPETERAAFLEWFGGRFRSLTWTCFSLLAITGLFNLWMRGVRHDDFLRPAWLSTTFGQIVAAKLTLVIIAIAVSVLHERVASRCRARWMGRALLLIGLAIVALAVMLVRAA